MYYYQLKYLEESVKRRAIESLKKLRSNLDLQIPKKTSNDHLLLATWNIRDLTKTKNRRLSESLHFIAEIISRFDILAIQEVNGLDEWTLIMDILGPNWDFISSDVSDKGAGGNGERLIYVFDKRKVTFDHVAGDIVLPPKLLISQKIMQENGKVRVKKKQFARTPYVATFSASWFNFALCTVHIYYGSDSNANLEIRRKEISAIATYFGKKADKELSQNRSMILLGDFNIYSKKHGTYEALTKIDFVIPKSLQSRPTNQSKTKFYDQIAFKADKKVLEFIDRSTEADQAKNAGVFESVFRFDQENAYEEEKGTSRRSFKTWRSYQMSDHLPM